MSFLAPKDIGSLFQPVLDTRQAIFYSCPQELIMLNFVLVFWLRPRRDSFPLTFTYVAEWVLCDLLTHRNRSGHGG